MSSQRFSDESLQRALSVQLQGVKSLASELILEWPEDVPFQARKILDEHPELRGCKSAVVEVAYEEFCRRLDAGEPLDPHEFARDFPDVRSSLWRLMEVHGMAANAPQHKEWPKAGDLFAGFHLLRELGHGAFSRVYLAEEVALGDRLVVVKVTTMGHAEAVALGRLEDDSIVPIYSVKPDPETGFLIVCMKFLGSATLVDVADAANSHRDAKKRAALILKTARAESGDERESLDRCVDAPFGRNWSYADGLVALAAQVADGLAFTHGQRFLHCDIKPSNILVSATGRAVLLDFNLAFSEDDLAARCGGTMAYMAPEQLLRTAGLDRQILPEIDARTDIYCLGVTLFELLTGQLPFAPPPKSSREEMVEFLIEQRRRGPRLNEAASIEPRLRRIVEKCLAFRPEDRFQSAAALAAALRREVSWVHRLRRWIIVRKKSATAALCAATVAAAAFGYHVATREPLSIRETNRALAANNAGDYAAAILAATRALQADPNNDHARFVRAVASAALGEDANALVDLQKIEPKIRDGRLYALMGYLRARPGTGEGASDHPWKVASGYYRAALDDGFDSAAVRNNLGCCFRVLQQPEAASREFHEALSRQPDLLQAHRNLLRLERSGIVNDPKSMPDLHRANLVVEHPAATAGAFLDAALSFALAAKNAPAEADRKAHLTRAIELMGQAIDRGLSPRRVESMVPRFSALTTDQRFLELIQRPEPQDSVESEDALAVNPVLRLHSLPAGVSAKPRRRLQGGGLSLP